MLEEDLTMKIFAALVSMVLVLGCISSPPSEKWVLKGFAVGEQVGNEYGNTIMADVIRLDNGTYRMYYGHSLGVIFSGNVPTANWTTSIKYAESEDGINWVVKGTILEGDSNPKSREYIISGPSVLRLPDGRYRMYYFASLRQEVGETPQLSIRSAISDDGVNFTKEGITIDVSPYDKTTDLKLAAHGTYFIAEDGTYVAIFSGDFTNEEGPSDLKMATSEDGLVFSNYTTLYKDWHDPIVIKTNDGYLLYATFFLDKYGMAFSPDGLNWPQEMTDIILVDSDGDILTPASSNVGDLGGILISENKTRLYANYGSPSSIAYFEIE